MKSEFLAWQEHKCYNHCRTGNSYGISRKPKPAFTWLHAVSGGDWVEVNYKKGEIENDYEREKTRNHNRICAENG